MKIEGIIFDWAGTTVDYGCFAPVQAFAEVFHAFGMEVTMEETRKPMGMLKRDHIKTMLEMPRIKRLWKSAHGRAVTEADIDAMHDTFTEKLMSILDQFADPKPAGYGTGNRFYYWVYRSDDGGRNACRKGKGICSGFLDFTEQRG